ncbi:MAG: biotin--[acetyl-CoA-carboxylase] ligase [Desulfobacter sp.]|nr:MAG: biotin--[acetyl-CoA-carboxylase] ligase [Desulfobacter sp.]
MKVNETDDNKSRILELLFRAGGKTLSGVKISDATGISRVAVWKHIKALKASGVDIEARPKGYVLADPGDLLHPFCFQKDLGTKIFHFPEVETTMDTAKALAREGASHLSCCVAERQTRGRGRLNREWHSHRGGLWFTLILKPDIPPPMAYIYNFAASLCLSRTINRLFGLDTRVKWPNDLLLGGKKLCGLLSEMETRADMVNFLAIGMGINVNNDPAHPDFSATSIKNELGRPVSRRMVLEEFLKDFSVQTRHPDIHVIMDLWRKQTSTIGTRVRVETLNRIHNGKAVGVDDGGSLIIETETGQTETIIYGDCFHN